MRARYEQTIALILRHIDEQGLAEGAQLPTESQFASAAGVSLVTVRRALAELAGQGIVRREQGRGTFVARTRLRADTTAMGALRNALHLNARSSMTTRMLGALERAATEAERDALALAEGASVWEISRLRLFNDRPLIREVSAIPVILAPDLGSVVRDAHSDSLYDILDRRYGLKEAREEQTLIPRAPLPDDQHLLEIRHFDWVVEVCGVSYSTRQRPIDRFYMVFVAKAFAFRFSSLPLNAFEAVELPGPR